MELLIIVIIILIIAVVLGKSVAYQNRISKVNNKFTNYFGEYKCLQNLRYRVQTDRKKIRLWDRQHKIDYIINNNKDSIIETLIKYNNYITWWEQNSEKILTDIKNYVQCLASEISIGKSSFIKESMSQIENLYNSYKPENIFYELSTYSYHENISHYNPNTHEWWTDDSHETNSFLTKITPQEMLNRVEILAQYNFEMTEYQYNCENQRKLMTQELRNSIIERDGCICKICGKKCQRQEIEIDHIQPISKGGKTTYSNLQVLCSKCNRQKSNKLLNQLNTQNEFHNIETTNTRLSIPDYLNADQFQEFEQKYNSTKYNNLSQEKDCICVKDIVTIKFLDSNETMTFRLMENFEKDENLLTISTNSPVGKAVLGQKLHDIIPVASLKQIEKIEIIDIKK